MSLEPIAKKNGRLVYNLTDEELWPYINEHFKSRLGLDISNILRLEGDCSGDGGAFDGWLELEIYTESREDEALKEKYYELISTGNYPDCDIYRDYTEPRTIDDEVLYIIVKNMLKIPEDKYFYIVYSMEGAERYLINDTWDGTWNNFGTIRIVVKPKEVEV